MIKSVYSSVLNYLKTKPLRLWLISLLAAFLVNLSFVLGGSVLLIGSCISILFSTAILMISYNAIKGKAFFADNLFDYFQNFDQALHIIGGTLYAELFVILWSLIPIVGPFIGIVRQYEYRLVPFILANEPDVRAKDARIISSMRTNGHKKDMFLTDIIWVIISVVLLIFLFSFSLFDHVGWFFRLLFYIVFVAFSTLAPVINNLIRAEFYDRLPDVTCTGKAIDVDEVLTEAAESALEAIVEPDIEVELVEVPAEEDLSEELTDIAVQAADILVAQTIADGIADSLSAESKTATKKAPAKKTSARKTSTRKPAAKKTVAKKAPAKKPAVKKTAAKKTPAKKVEEPSVEAIN